MDARTLSRIFEPFFTTKPVGKGTGLGLAVVHGILKSHAAAVTVESEMDRGTHFRIYFPAQLSPERPAAEPPADLPAGHGQRILVVDDEPPLTRTLMQILTRLNYQVVTHNNAREAIAAFEQNPGQFAAVLTDLTMPEINGLELARQIHQLHPAMPIILASGFTAEVPLDSLASLGVVKVLDKPISLAVLAETLNRVLNRLQK